MATRPTKPATEPPNPRRFPWWLIGLLIIGVALVAFQYWPGRGDDVKRVPLSELAQAVKAGQVQKIEISGEGLNVTLKDGTKQRSDREPDASLTESLGAF